MTLPFALTPLPLIANACGIDALFVKSNVTVPALAFSVVVVNFSAPFGSAATGTPLPPPDELEAGVEVGVAVGVLPPPPPPLLLFLLLLLPPQPATARAATVSRHAMTRIRSSCSHVCSRERSRWI